MNFDATIRNSHGNGNENSVDTKSIAGYNIIKEQKHAVEPGLNKPVPHPAHPLDQLTIQEIPFMVKLIREYAGPKDFKFNAITLREPKKHEYAAFRAGTGPRPDRRALAIALERGVANKVIEVIVNLTQSKVEDWKELKDVGTMLTLEDLDVCERVCRKHPQVVEACRGIGITDMSNVYFDAWAIGVDDRWGFERRLQQGLAYYRTSRLDNHYAHPLDLSVVVDTETEEVLSVDIRTVHGERTKVPLAEHNYLPDFIGESYQQDVLKPIDVTQPEGVSFQMRGNELSWAGFKMHIGFNYREGIVISDLRVDDMHERRERTLFNRISVVEMVVPYGQPAPPHHRKHAFDIGEYGMGYMTNSLKLGCDCKGAIHYLDGVVATGRGEAAVIKNAICIHEEDNGLLYKHTDFRDGNVITVRDRKLIISQIITAANYDYAFYHTLSLDGTYKLEVKLTGMLNTYCLHPSETAGPYGSQVTPEITAHNHQHIFSLRLDPSLDGPNNSIVQTDALSSPEPVGSPKNPFGNGFYAHKTPLLTSKAAATSYKYETSRSWDIINPTKLNPMSGKPVAYKILNPSSPALLAQPGSIVDARAAFARKSLWVVPYRDYELYPAGDYVPQSRGGPNQHPANQTVEDWVARDESIDNTDIVCYVQFGLTHFPRTEDFPIMPAEPVSVMLRASGFFERNPGLWVPPSSVAVDTTSRDAFPTAEKRSARGNEKANGANGVKEINGLNGTAATNGVNGHGCCGH